MSPNCRGTYFVTLMLGRFSAPLWGPALGQGRSARRRRCGGAFRARCWSLRGGSGAQGGVFGAGTRVAVLSCRRGRGRFRAECRVVGQACRPRRVRVRRRGWAGCCWVHCGAGGGREGRGPLIVRRWPWMQEPQRVKGRCCGLQSACGSSCGLGSSVGVLSVGG